MIPEDVMRVFFHEVGHFVAREINHMLYGSTSTKKITIFPNQIHNHLYEGDTKIHLSVDGNENKPPARQALAAYLASSTYGCFFQAYFLNTELKKCFNDNGADDLQKWYGSLMHNDADFLNSDIAEIDRKYFEELKANQELSEIMHLNVNGYLDEESGNTYFVNIEKLRVDINNFILKHQATYKTLIEKYEEVFSQNSI